jgi:hypothetical protein
MPPDVGLSCNFAPSQSDPCANSHATSIDISEEEYRPLLIVSSRDFTIAEMKNALHLSLAFSPLLALVPRKLAGEGIRRDHMLAVSSITLLFVHMCSLGISMQLPWEMTGPKSYVILNISFARRLLRFRPVVNWSFN